MRTCVTRRQLNTGGQKWNRWISSVKQALRYLQRMDRFPSIDVWVVGHGTSDRLWEMSFSSLRKKRCLLETCRKKYRKRHGPHKKQKGRLFKQLIGWKDREPIWPPCSRHSNFGCVIGSKDCVIFGKWSIIPVLQLVVFACVYVPSCWLSVFIDSWEKQHRGLA